MNLIGITGRLHAGKDEAAKAFIAEGYTRHSFADPLKAVTAFLADEPVTLYHDQQAKEEHSDLLGMTRRKALQLLGTEGIRNTLGADFWARRLMWVWTKSGRPKMVVADCRFDNEAEILRANGGKVIRIIRPDNDADSVGVPGHASERGVSDHLIDFTIVNDGTISDLHSRCAEVLAKIRAGV